VRYHLPLGFVWKYLSLYRFPSPSPSVPLLASPSPSHSCSLSPSHPLFPSLSQSLSHRPASASHPVSCHCHCQQQDGSFHCSAHRDPPSSLYHHPCQLSHPNSVVFRPGCHLRVLPAAWRLNHCHETIATVSKKTRAGAFNLPWACRLRAGAIDLITEGTWVVPPHMFIRSQVLPNICPTYERKAAHHSRKRKHLHLGCGHISRNCEKWRVTTGSSKIILYTRSHALSSWTPKHCIFAWDHGCVPRWIPPYWSNLLTGVDLHLMLAILP